MEGLNQEFYTGKEVQEKLRISAQTLKLWRNDGKISCIRLSPKKFLYSKSEVDDMISDGREDVLESSFALSFGTVSTLLDTRLKQADRMKIIKLVCMSRGKNISVYPTEESKFYDEDGAYVARPVFAIRNKQILIEARICSTANLYIMNGDVPKGISLSYVEIGLMKKQGE